MYSVCAGSYICLSFSALRQYQYQTTSSCIPAPANCNWVEIVTTASTASLMSAMLCCNADPSSIGEIMRRCPSETTDAVAACKWSTPLLLNSNILTTNCPQAMGGIFTALRELSNYEADQIKLRTEAALTEIGTTTRNWSQSQSKELSGPLKMRQWRSSQQTCFHRILTSLLRVIHDIVTETAFRSQEKRVYMYSERTPNSVCALQ